MFTFRLMRLAWWWNWIRNFSCRNFYFLLSALQAIPQPRLVIVRFMNSMRYEKLLICSAANANATRDMIERGINYRNLYSKWQSAETLISKLRTKAMRNFEMHLAVVTKACSQGNGLQMLDLVHSTARPALQESRPDQPAFNFFLHNLLQFVICSARARHP